MAERTSRQSFLIAGIIITAVAVFGFILITRFANNESRQNLKQWEDRLGLVADSRVSDASAWLNRHLKTIEDLSTDASLQLYASQIISDDDEVLAEAQRGFVFSLLSAEAERSGFHEVRAIDPIGANIRRPRRAGIALIDGDGNGLVTTTGMPQISHPSLAKEKARKPFIMLGPQLSDKTKLVLFGAPIGDIGNIWLIGAKPLDSDFLKTLEQPGAVSNSAKTYVVSPAVNNDQNITAITPIGASLQSNDTLTDNASLFALKNPGLYTFDTDTTGNSVLVTGREFTAPVPWILVRSISSTEVSADIDRRYNNLIVTLSLFIAVIVTALVLIWRISVSRKLEVAFEEQSRLSATNAALSVFLKTLSDSQPTAIAALNKDFKIHFANRGMCNLLGIDEEAVTNSRFDSVFPIENAEKFREAIDKAANGAPSEFTMSYGQDTKRLYHVQSLSLNTSKEYDASVLLVMQDVTELVKAQEKTELLLRQLVASLTEIIDARDPWAKHHSARVSDVACAIAQEIGWSDKEIESLSIAGQLVNLGKIFVPSNILTKETPLSDDELDLVRHSMQRAANLVKGIDFDGPVAEMMEQIQENWDGSGEPDGRKAEEIEAGARILTVANAFVGMVSSRAHRKSLGFDKTIDILQNESGSKFDRRAVAALQNILENRDGRQEWGHYTETVDQTDE
ncbi:HD-GYP domain-containing protein [Kordiimonas sp. SCSIO 12610]|uniref:HD-GYP domain-containing protein n=1 Tax=Kordiimonas sp. SCSIO 12610 TaxID=2829597 RepID=UPI00210F027A|nr:HD domain-containing phosphohydrolase [Kordiimonas sp. SCSIO 12610]UTW55639.1 PAS domain-containing protein [Kordiimonas sp. SCSIO 12610]